MTTRHLMTQGRLSISMDARGIEAIRVRLSGSWGERSQVVAKIVERYAMVVRLAQPKLTAAEWKLGGAVLQGQAARPQFVHHLVKDALEIEGPDKVGRSLLRKLDALDYAGRVAFVDTIERYWAARARGEKSARLPGGEK